MKKITLLFAFCLLSIATYADIVHRDIADVVYTHGSFTAANIDFNNDGTAEFIFEEQGDGSVGSFFDPAAVNFIGTGTLNSGHGWDIIKALINGHTIDATGSFDAQGDAYINVMWANANEFFPEGESFVGVRFKLGANTHYGWMKVKSTTGVITLMSYAYNDTPGAAIKAGDISLSVQDFDNSLSVNYYPNPVTDYLIIETQTRVNQVKLFDINGNIVLLTNETRRIDLRYLATGVYFLYIDAGTKGAMRKLLVK